MPTPIDNVVDLITFITAGVIIGTCLFFMFLKAKHDDDQINKM